MHHKSHPIYHWLVLALAFFSFAMSALLSRTVFQRLPHLEDEVAYLFQARILARGDLVIPSPELQTAFWQPFILDREGHRFGKYPLAWPVQLALGIAAGAGWLVNACYAALNVAIIYRLGSNLFNRDTGLIAAALASFSPMALLLGGTLMGHSSSLFFATLFLYAIWKMEHNRHASRWGMLAGLALGMVVANRPLSGLAVGLPLIAWSIIRLAVAFNADIRGRNGSHATLTALRPMGVLAVVTLLLAATIPLFSAVATGDPTVNLYTEVWSYDQIGFGECCGRSGHTLAKGFNHLSYDLSLLAADLFGWQIGRWTNTLVTHLQQEADTFPNLGLSWVMLPFGLTVAFRRHSVLIFLWLALGMIWVWFASTGSPQRFVTPESAWLWIVIALIWALAPLIAFVWGRSDKRSMWTWILIALVVSVLITHMTYWVGSQRYSTRYYFEALTPLALLSALPLAWLAQRHRRFIVLGGMGIVLLLSLFTYSLPRIQVLHGFNNVSQTWINAALSRQVDNQPLLVIMTGQALSWRAMGSFMVATSPYLDSEIVGAYNRVQDIDDQGLRPQLIAMFPNRQVIDMRGNGAVGDFVEMANGALSENGDG